MSDQPTETARAAWRAGDLTAQQRMARDQQELAADGKAVGQCQSCGTYRLDGQPPILHHDGCAEKPLLTPFHNR